MRRSLPSLAFAGLSLLWGSEWILMALLPAQPRLRWLALQYGVAALLLLPWAWRRRVLRHGRSQLARMSLAGFSLLALPQILMFPAAGHFSSDISTACLALVPLLLAVAGRLPIPLAVTGLAGVLFTARRALDVPPLPQLPWLLLPLAAAMVMAGGLVVAERQIRMVSIAELLFVQCAGSGLLLGLASWHMEPQILMWSTTAVAGLTAAAVLTVLGAYAGFYWLLRQVGAARGSALQWSQPLVIALESAAFYRVHPAWTEIAGAVLIVGACMAVFRWHGEEDGGVHLQITQG